MRVGASDAEGTDAGAARRITRLPIGKLCVHIKRAATEIDLRIGPLKVQAGWNHPTIKSQSRLDQACHACSRIQMPEVCFDRTDGAESFGLGLLTKDLR